MSFPSGSDGKESTCNAGDLCSVPVLGRSPGEGSGHPLQDSCQENPTDKGAWWATVYGVTESLTWWNMSWVNNNQTFCDDFFFQSLKPKKYVNILLSLYGDYGLPQCSVVKNPPAMQETRETGFHPWVRKIPLEEGMATHSSVLAWRIPWTEEPGGLQSMGTHGVRHNWSNLAHIWLLCLSKCSGYLRGYGGQ